MGSQNTPSAHMRTTNVLNGGSRRRKQIHKTFNNIKVTLLCGFVTILVLRGTIGLNSLISHEEADQNLAEETNRILVSIRSDNDPEEQAEEEEILTLNATYTLGPRITTWDQDRKLWLEKNPEFSNYLASGKPRVMLVTGSPPKPCDNAIGDHYLLKAIKNKIDYCRIHGIEFFSNMALLDKDMTQYWAKMPLVRKLMLSHPEIEWFWWMDSDALFTDIPFEIPFDKYKDHNMVVHGYPDLLDQKAWIGLNAGIFLIRNCQWTLDLFDDWAPMGPKGPIREEAGKILTGYLKGRPAFEADDQSALIYLMLTKTEWSNKIFVENSFYLHGYWEGLVDRYEEMIEKYHPGLGDERWPFITHFVGCKPCGSYGDYPLERCFRSIERAFNFADNQVLNLYGFRHKGLVSPNVKRIRNDTDMPLINVYQFDIRRTINQITSSQN